MKLNSFQTVGWCALLGAVLPINFSLAKDFPQWRGPDRDGHASERGLLQEWPPAGPKLLWQRQDIDAGYSTPAVVKERLFLVSNQGLENEFALALSAKDGSRLWSAALGKVGNPKQQPSYPAARTTPTVDGRWLYALGSDGDLVCLATDTGREKWRRHLRRDFGGMAGEWAYSESPLVDGRRLICTPGGSNATVVALDKSSGELIWKCSVPGGSPASYASAMAFTAQGVRQYVQFLQDGLIGMDAKSGRLLWRYERTAKGSPAVIMTPLVSDGLIYSGAYRAGGALVKPVRKPDGTWAVEEMYFSPKLPTGIGGVVKVGDQLYGSSGQSLMCVNFNTGEIRWEERSLAPASWLVADHRIYVHAESGEVGLLRPDPTGLREVGRFAPPNQPKRMNQMEKAWAYPVIADGRLFLRDMNCLWCYDLRAK